VKQFRDTVRVIKNSVIKIFFVQDAALDFQVHLKHCRLPWDLPFLCCWRTKFSGTHTKWSEKL